MLIIYQRTKMSPPSLVACLLLVVRSVQAYSSYMPNIPNGNSVPDPCCETNSAWLGVGHQSPGGGDPRNPFGLSYATYRGWDSTFCGEDSDGDGKTNGEELGDPDCIWTKGATPSRTTGLSHPGVCEPLGSPQCQGKNSFDVCKSRTTCDPSTTTSTTTTTTTPPTTTTTTTTTTTPPTTTTTTKPSTTTTTKPSTTTTTKPSTTTTTKPSTTTTTKPSTSTPKSTTGTKATITTTKPAITAANSSTTTRNPPTVTEGTGSGSATVNHFQIWLITLLFLLGILMLQM